MDPYNLGKEAYEAYCATTHWKSAITGAKLPFFDETTDAVRTGWIAAADRVRRIVEGEIND